MSRPEDLPRAASPMKRRAGSAPSDDTPDPDAADVDMLGLPPAANSDDIAIIQSDIIPGVEDTVEDVWVDSPPDDASTAAQVDDRDDEDALDLLNLNMDQESVNMDHESVYETHAGSDVGDLEGDAPGLVYGPQPQEQEPNQEAAQDQDAGDSKTQTNGSSATNTDEAADSDAKTADTVGTSTSVDTKGSSLLLGPKYDFGASNYKSNQSGRSSPTPPYSTRARQRKEDRKGLTGLSNLGNTCYMNSALQCIRSVEELTKYFLTGEHEEEVNYENRLGHKGDIANAYANLLNMIHKKFSSQSSVSPRHFKDVVGRYAPQFGGWLQQDTQEFLGFLLDGLQEDLSRVKNKPYIEKPDSTDEMVGNPELIRRMADEVWDIHKRRDDSVIGDLFTGLYQSTLVCPNCDKVSITFEPFNNLTLPLPVRNTHERRIRYFPLNDRPVDLSVELDRAMSVKGLKTFISSRVGVPAERIFGAEEYKDRFFKVYEDNQQAWEEMELKTDNPCFFELEGVPTNVGPAARKKFSGKTSGYPSTHDGMPPYQEDPALEALSQRLLVPVVHRFNPRYNNNSIIMGSRLQEKVGPPHFILLTPAEARNEDAIRRKILEKVLTFTNHPEIESLATTGENQPAEVSNVDPALISVSDLDSSGDSHVVAKSIEGEDDLVDVSMQDAASATQAAEEYPHLLKKFNTKRPDWVDPTVFLDGRLQTLFDLSYFSEGNHMATTWTGFSTSVTDKIFPRLATRKPQAQTPSDPEMPSPSGSGTASEESSADEAAEVTPVFDSGAVTRMEDESSDSESLPDLENLPNPVHRHVPEAKLRGGKKPKPKKPAQKVYGKKNRANKKFNKQQNLKTSRYSPQLRGGYNFQDDDPEEGSKADGGPLIRLGEGIIVDWDQASWNVVYGLQGDSTESPEHAPYSTFKAKDIGLLADARLEAEQVSRQARQRVGINLYDCLDEFEKEEILSEEDKWFCPRCKDFCRAAKKFDLWLTPDVLIVHLKRFSSTGSRRDKIDAVVDFPIEGLDITTRVLNKDGKQEVYDLIAVDDHMGGLGGGHYTAFAKNFQDSNWYKFDDTHVSPVRNTNSMISGHAYLLFYRRRSDRPLGGPKLEEACRKYAAENEPDGEEEAARDSEGAESR